MQQLLDAIQDNKLSEKLMYFSTAQLERELAIRKETEREANLYENKDVVDYDDVTGKPCLTEER